MVGAMSVTIRVDEDTKREFDAFCANVGMSLTTALNMYMKAVLRTRKLPFAVTDVVDEQMQARQALKEVFRQAQEESVRKGTDKITMEEINAEIATYRQERRAQLCR